ncbi:DUF1947 domain-containing protein [Metallosphaera tengchongensis]|uniref:DUF1947 domain-containing protein n=1 Tax=Metallosphaera tengchongensis TaxID=1532350 RepID=A0A6N0NW85_9CREN|nr:DUF1947 domain-containing protein [Metallosphaera tengchongensis]
MQKHPLSQKETREFLSKLKDIYGLNITAEKVEVGKEKRNVYYFIDGKLSFVEDGLIPTLCFLQEHEIKLPFVVVDEGAVKAVARGADLYAPGVLEVQGTLDTGKLLLVKAKQGQIIAVMRISEGAEEAMRNKKGKIASNVHYIGDDLWKMCRSR